MKKLKLFSLLMLLFVGVTSIWGADIVVTLEDIGHDLGSTANTTMDSVAITAKNTTTSYKINYYQCKKQGESMFLTKSFSPFISNHTAMPGDIKSVKVTINTGAAKATTYDCAFSASECTSAISGVGAVNITGGNSNTYNNPSVTGKRYFCITLGNANNGQVLSLEITCASPTEPLITTEPDSIGFGVKNIFNNDAAKSGSATIKVTGSNLTANISAAISGTNADKFSLSTASLDKESEDADLTISYAITAAGNYSASLTLSSDGADDIVIPITLKVVNELQQVDTLTRQMTGITGGYGDFANKGANLDAEYSGNSAKYSSNNSDAIQLRASSSSGIVTTFSDGLARKVVIKWNTNTTNARYVDIYGKNTAYAGSSDLYGENKGTKIGSIVKGTSTELEIEDDYAYIGFLASNAIYMDTVFITWAPATDKPAVTISDVVGGTLTVAKSANNVELSSGDKVAAGKKLSVTATPNGTTHMGGTVTAYKTGDPSTEVTITNGELTMPEYPITISATFDPRPRVTLSPKSRNFGIVEQGDEVSPRNFTITGADLTGELTVTPPTGYNCSVTDGNLTPTDGAVNAVITVTPVTTNFGTFNGNIKVNGGGLAEDTALVAVSMTIIAKNEVTISQPSNGVITVKNASNEDVATGTKVVVGKRMKVTVAPNDATKHRETLKIYKTGDESTTISVDENDSITMPSYPITITSTEVALYAVALDVKEDGVAASHGTSATMDGDTETLYKAAGETVTLVASRVTGYQFVNWTASSEDITFDVATKADGAVATINGAGTITANFEAVPELLVSVTALDLGHTKKNGSLDPKSFTISGASLAKGNLTLVLDNSIKDAFTLNYTSIPVDGTLAETTITVTPVTTVAGNYSGNLTISGGNLAEAKTVALTSIIDQTYTVTWMVNGVAAKTTTDTEGTALVAPSTGSITGKVSQGWTDAVIDGKTDDKPTIVSLSTMPAKDTTLYALYATENSNSQVKEFSCTIVYSDFEAGYSASDGNHNKTAVCTTDNTLTLDVQFTSSDMCHNNTTSIQGRKSHAGEIYNAKKWGKEVKSVTINGNGTGDNAFAYVIGASSEPTESATGAFFKITSAKNTYSVSSIEIVFDSTVTVTTYDAYITNAYTVTFEDPDNGDLTVRASGGLINSGAYVYKGESLTIVATPSQGYKIASVTANGEALSGTDGNYSYNVGTQNVVIAASFEEDSASGFEDVEDSVKAVKVLRNGVLYIEKSGRVYNAQGQLVK